jgi:hypothetical protein
MQRSVTVTRRRRLGWAPVPDLGWRRRPKLHGMQGVKARIGLAVPGRPIGPWSRRTGAPEASATGRDRTLRSVLGPRRTRTTGARTVTNGEDNPQVVRPPAQAARTTPAAGSDCGPNGRGSVDPSRAEAGADARCPHPLARSSATRFRGRPGRQPRRSRWRHAPVTHEVDDGPFAGQLRRRRTQWSSRSGSLPHSLGECRLRKCPPATRLPGKEGVP